MKKTLQNTLKVGAAIALMLSAGAVRAQQKAGDITKAPNAAPTTVDGAVRVIDNKGTIKYLQSSNGITTYTNETPAGGVTTTWQLGGTLIDDTDIKSVGKDFSITLESSTGADPKEGQFILNGVKANIEAAATEIKTDGTKGSGFTLLVRDEASGAVKKMLATDLITSGQTYFTAFEGQEEFDVSTGNGSTVPGMSYITMVANQIPLPKFDKVWVYRNGAKLIAGLDYTIDDSKVFLNHKVSATPNDWKVYAGDIIEVQYYK